jgi:hypothetical protein
MFLERYEVVINDDFTDFEFLSIGKKGIIRKAIRFNKFRGENTYNLGFGDLIGDTNQIDDKVITDNGDSEKILATVASTLYVFTLEKADVSVFFKGSNQSRTRLYQIGISKYFEEISESFTVLGLTDLGWQSFNKQTNYHGFLIKRKKI